MDRPFNAQDVTDDWELWSQALDAYFKKAEDAGDVPLQPGQDDSWISEDYVHFANFSGELARYVIEAGEIIEPPVEDEDDE